MREPRTSRPLPVAEATYPPPSAARRVLPIAFAMLGVGVLVLGSAGAMLVARVQRQRISAQRASQMSALTTLANAYAARAFQKPDGPTLVSRYEDTALVDVSPQPVRGARPRLDGAAPPVRILAGVRRDIEGSVPRTLLFVAYDVTGGSALPETRAADTALAFVGSGYRAYPGDAVVLLVWSDGPAGASGRAYAVDFPAHVSTGVAVTAVEPAAREGPVSVAFALGDPLSGTGRLISRWVPVAEASQT